MGMGEIWERGDRDGGGHLFMVVMNNGHVSGVRSKWGTERGASGMRSV